MWPNLQFPQLREKMLYQGERHQFSQKNQKNKKLQDQLQLNNFKSWVILVAEFETESGDRGVIKNLWVKKPWIL